MRLFFVLSLFLCLSSVSLSAAPEFHDYCKFLERDVTDSDHGFIAGNQLYYVGGKSRPSWELFEHQSLGFSHPFFRDGSFRGFGKASGETGYGHDQWGWEFWNEVKVADAVVLYQGKQYQRPKPDFVRWRPDQQISSFTIGDAVIDEVKFINKNDVLIAVITSNKDLDIKFEGHSFYFSRKTPTFDGDPSVPYMSDLHPLFSREGLNAIQIEEHGNMMTKTNWGKPIVKGKMMYEGVNFVLASSVDFQDFHSERMEEGFINYDFTVHLSAGKEYVLTYSANRDRKVTLDKAKAALVTYPQDLKDKTAYINNLLNEQIPYFRCSDDSVVRTYYYLWAIYFMYFTDNKSGFDNMPHTQTAVNNFMGLHVYDSWAYSALGSWVNDKETWGYGHLLLWKQFLKYSENGMMIDNFGTEWWSPNQMTFIGMVPATYKMFHHSGDYVMLEDAYEMFQELYGRAEHLEHRFGIGEVALEYLMELSNDLENYYDYGIWKRKLSQCIRNSSNLWDYSTNYIKKPNIDFIDICDLFALYCSKIPRGFAQKISDEWIMDTEKGFLSIVPLDVRPVAAIENGVFAVSSISTWLAVDAMFEAGLIEEAILCTLGHIHGMNKDYGYPVAPECWNPDYKPWCDLHYNWDTSILLPLLEHIAGLEYSVVDNRLEINEHLPDCWDFMEVSFPVNDGQESDWTSVSYQRQGNVKTVSVSGHEFKNTKINLWNENREIVGGKNNRNTASVELGNRTIPLKSYVKIYPEQGEREFVGSTQVELNRIATSGTVRYAWNQEELTATSKIYDTPLIVDTTSVLKCAVFDGNECGPVYEVKFTETDAKPALEIDKTDLLPGLIRTVYTTGGIMQSLPDFSTLSPVQSDVFYHFGFDGIPEEENFAMLYEGYLDISHDAVYKFQLGVNDGGRVYIDDELVIDFNLYTAHAKDPWRKNVNIPLEKGLHKLRVEFFQGIERKFLEFKIATGHEQPHNMGRNMFFHDSKQ